MAYDEGLAARVREHLAARDDIGIGNVEEKKMFGGLCFMVAGHMCCGIVGDTLMLRVGPQQYSECLGLPHAREMDFTGKPMKGMLYVDAEGITEDEELAVWITRSLRFISGLPSK